MLERAKATMADAVPGSRLPGSPLAEALLGFETGLRDVRERMEGWRATEVEDVWRACSDALDESLARAERVRIRGEPPVGFEALVGLVSELLAPLEAFLDAGARFRELGA